MEKQQRAIRRAHNARLKKARTRYWASTDWTPRLLGLVLNTPAICSCYMCGNQRKVWGRAFSELREHAWADDDEDTESS